MTASTQSLLSSKNSLTRRYPRKLHPVHQQWQCSCKVTERATMLSRGASTFSSPFQPQAVVEPARINVDREGQHLHLDRPFLALHVSLAILTLTIMTNFSTRVPFKLLFWLDGGLLFGDAFLRTSRDLSKSSRLCHGGAGNGQPMLLDSLGWLTLPGFLLWWLILFTPVFSAITSILSCSGTFLRSSRLSSLGRWLCCCYPIFTRGGTCCIESLHNVAKFVARGAVSL